MQIEVERHIYPKYVCVTCSKESQELKAAIAPSSESEVVTAPREPSLIQTAKANGLEPYWYLWYLFEQLPYATRDTEKLRELLPMYVDPEVVKKQP